MYSRETSGRNLRSPPRYSGTAFRSQEKAATDAVGRPSALPEPLPQSKAADIIVKKEEIKSPPIEMEEKVAPVQAIAKSYSDEIIIGALILSLIGGRGGEEDITLLLLLLLLIL